MLTKEDDDMADLHLSDGEWKLMKVLWQQSPRTLGALVAALAPTTGWSKATVFMMLKRLIAKGAVTLDESGKYQQYSAAVAYAEVEPEDTPTVFPFSPAKSVMPDASLTSTVTAST